ncbi:MAG: 3-isopropylmalate dehydratase small subunit [Syntrophorhabdaceae bacterium]|nr:3-isopropylmalate dehydratase small subunit [Syntrophorhabdaceae bacterium]MDD4195797.1 3-isopropylmalate dehydratase small subunit [Syntrophorhabdaceae bacterium]HOC46887.1 3-isopropylmalate dehydratase small subunit [Syntrophorhabdaceae bacterium]
MVIRGNAWLFGDDISTDHIIPGRFYHLRSNLDELKKHVFDDISPGFSNKVKKSDIIVGGRNFGLGSSREHAPLIIKMAGIDAIIARSFARIFYRNAINVGLAAIICPIEGLNEGDELQVRLNEGVLEDITTGAIKRFAPLPSIMQDILNEGGLDAYIRKYKGFTI